jgi:formate hydrogenlyase subunit 6/NADH:ubiquinone oxidoreductase subunit I
MCADFCPRKAIELTKDYLMIGQDKEEFMTRGTFTKKPPQKPVVSTK